MSSDRYKGNKQSNDPGNDLLSDELREAIRHMVANISKSFIVEWYNTISETNHDFVVCCESLIENALVRLTELSVTKLDKYRVGQLVTNLIHDHVLNESNTEKIQSIENQIDNYEYDICQNSVVRLFGLLCTDDIRRVIFTKLSSQSDLLKEARQFEQHTAPGTSSQYKERSQYNINREFHSQSSTGNDSNRTTSALYTLVIAMLTKAVFMPIVESISEPNWLYAVIIWLCKKEERELAKRLKEQSRPSNNGRNHRSTCGERANSNRKFTNDEPDASNCSQKTKQPTPTIVTNSRTYRSLDLEEGIDIASANINFDNPICDSLKRPLDNIEIYATEEVKSNNSCYVLYCIRFEGLYHRHPSAGFSFIPEQPDLPIIDKRATNVTSRRLVLNHERGAGPSSTIGNTDSARRKSFRRRMTIKRRFREFVILQLRLEENPKIRPYMKNIPKPTKLKAATQNIFSLPGITNIKLDQSTIKLRQRFLERFLIALNSSPFIANSYEFKEFFSFNGHPAGISMSKSKSLILQVNLNKVFVDGVRSAFSILRSSLPDVRKAGEDSNLGSNPDPDAWLIELQQSTMKLHVQTRTSHSKMTLERYIDSKLSSINGRSSRHDKTSSLDRYNDRASNHHRETGGSRGGSLRPHLVKSGSNSSNTNSSSNPMSRSSSSNSQGKVDSSSPSTSTESIYYDASSELKCDNHDRSLNKTLQCDSIQICDSVPVASKLIDIVHYSISGDPSCSESILNSMARLFLGKFIERFAIRLLGSAFTLEVATFCINGITSSIWDESDDPPLDLEGANLEEAVEHLTRLLGQNYPNYSFIPRQLLDSLAKKQLGFYLSQLSSQKRNKFVIYSFFVHLLDELEMVDSSGD